MFVLVCIFLILLLVATRRAKGPVWALAISWLVCIVPIATQVIRYEYLSPSTIAYPLILIGFLSCFAFGAAVASITAVPMRPRSGASGSAELAAALPWAYAAWWAAAIGTACLYIDFTWFEGASLDDFAVLRDMYLAKEATLFARIGSILTWGCLYCFIFALTFRKQLLPSQFVLFLIPVIGYFLSSLFSGGRQAAMQIAIFSLLTLALRRARFGTYERKQRIGFLMPLGISAAMIVYMGFIAFARNDGLISTDKVEVLAQLFDFEMAPFFDEIIGHAGAGVRTAVVEGLVYFSSSVALFSKFLTIDFPEHLFGAMSLPFVFRQLEPLTGISVIGALEKKIELMSGSGVIGVGWTTGISSYIIDFGMVGAAFLLILQGYYSARTWCRARNGRDFNDDVIALVMLSAAIYMPLSAATADTNLLLLWLYSAFARRHTHRQAHRHRQRWRERHDPGSGKIKRNLSC